MSNRIRLPRLIALAFASSVFAAVGLGQAHVPTARATQASSRTAPARPQWPPDRPRSRPLPPSESGQRIGRRSISILRVTHPTAMRRDPVLGI
jgi:hypothetical protein